MFRALKMASFTLATAALLADQAYGVTLRSPFTPDLGLTPIRLITPQNIRSSMISEAELAKSLENFCQRLQEQFHNFGWKEAPCDGVNWRADVRTANGHPLIYQVFGEGKETSMVLSAVHPDEMTPVPMGFRFAKYLAANPGVLDKEKRIIVAPLINPDGFLRNLPSRTNSNGVDTNRNFFTTDWYDLSRELWSSKKKRDPRYFPGYFPNTEIETFFQMQLIDFYRPDKILSIHAPLGFLDYDGPGDQKFRTLSESERQAKQLPHAISEKSKNYRVVDYSFYPGSLGNYAGNERSIPTVTLELETTDARRVDAYWEQFLPGLLLLIDYPFKLTEQAITHPASDFVKWYLTLPEAESI